MVSFLFYSKGNAPFVNQKSIIQNHLFLVVLPEKIRGMVISMAVLGIRVAGWPLCHRMGWVQGWGE